MLEQNPCPMKNGPQCTRCTSCDNRVLLLKREALADLQLNTEKVRRVRPGYGEVTAAGRRVGAETCPANDCPR